MSRYSDDTLVMALVRQAGAVLDRLCLPDAFTLTDLQARVEEERGRRIHIMSRPLPPQGPHGIWVMGETDDYIFVDETAPPLRRAQIIGHEFGHMLFDDRGGPLAQTTLVDPRAGDQPDQQYLATALAGVLHGCTRSGYDEIVEQRCEWFGTVVVQRLTPIAPA